MIPFEKAKSLILPDCRPQRTADVLLREQSGQELSGLTLAEAVSVPRDLPLFDNSAVDGFGVQLNDVASASSETPIRRHQWIVVATRHCQD